MDIFKKYRWMTAGFVTMLLLNLVLVATVWFTYLRPRPAGPEFQMRTQQWLASELEFSAEQRRQLGELQHQHMQAMHQHMNQIQEYRRQLFLARQQEDAPRNDSLTARIGRMQAEMEQSLSHHFQQIREICTPEQRQRFDEVLQQVLQRTDRQQGMQRRQQPQGQRRPGAP